MYHNFKEMWCRAKMISSEGEFSMADNQTIIVYVVAGVIAYLIGTVSPSYMVSRKLNKDFRGGGSGNFGASNTAILVGMKWGVIVGLCDILKACIPVLVAKFFFSEYIYLQYVVATCVILGHIYPFYLKFKGGKGFATFFGSILGIHWLAFIVIGIIFLVVVFLSDKIVIGTFTTITLFPIYVWLVDKNIWFVAIILVATLVIYCKHIDNIKRLINGEEFGIREVVLKKKTTDV